MSEWGRGGGWGAQTHVFDLLDGKICVRWYADCVWTHVDDHHYGSCDEALEKLVNFQICSAQFRSSLVPPNHAFPR